MTSSLSSCWGTEESTLTPSLNENWPQIDKCREYGLQDSGTEQADTPTVDVYETLQSLTSAVRELGVKFQAVATLEMVQKEIAIINDRLARLEEQTAIRVAIQSLAPYPYEIIKPIEAVIQFVDGEYVASFFDANITTGGDSQAEAIFNLRALTVGTFEILAETKDSDLGPGPLQDKKTLEEFVRRK